MVDSSAIEGIETPSVNLEFFSWKRLNKKIVCDMLILHLALRCSGIFIFCIIYRTIVIVE